MSVEGFRPIVKAPSVEKAPESSVLYGSALLLKGIQAIEDAGQPLSEHLLVLKAKISDDPASPGANALSGELSQHDMGFDSFLSYPGDVKTSRPMSILIENCWQVPSRDGAVGRAKKIVELLLEHSNENDKRQKEAV